MKKLRLCHSFWSAPCSDGDKLRANVWLYALSVAYAKKTGAKIVLHTDEKGKELLGFLPYDELHTTLQGITVNPRFWAAGKIFAQAAEPLGSIHIDGDVFIKRKNTIDLRRFQASDLIIQNIENFEYPYIVHNIPYVKQALVRDAEMSKRLRLDENLSSYNCGVVGFNSQELKDQYISGYKRLYNILVSNKKVLRTIELNRELIPDLVIEQYWLTALAESRNAKVYALIADNYQRDAIRIHYTHLLGKTKYNGDVQKRIREMLKALNENIYKKIINKWQQ
jgi:hypothetical protein